MKYFKKSSTTAFLLLMTGFLLYGLSGCNRASNSPTGAVMNVPVSAQMLPSSLRMNLEVWNPGDTANYSRVAARITNWGTDPISLSRIKIKAWFRGIAPPPSHEVYVGESWANNQTVFAPGGTWVANVDKTNVSIATGPESSCATDRLADWTVTASFSDDPSKVIPAAGGYVESNSPPSSLAAWHLDNWANMDKSQDYSRITEAGNNSAGRSNLKYFSLYVDDQLVCEWVSPAVMDSTTGLQPCGISGCGVTAVADPTSTPAVIVALTGTPDPSVTPDPSPVLTATAVNTATSTATNSFTATGTFTSTATRTFTATATATSTSTNTFTATATPTDTNTSTNTSTATATFTATDTATDPPLPTATSTSLPVTALRLQYMTYHPTGQTNNPSVLFRVFNDGNTQVDLSKVEVRYWFSNEGTSSTATNVDWAGFLPPGMALTGMTSETLVPTSGHGTQDRYASYTFSTGAGLLPPAQWVEAQTRFNKTDWSNYTQTNDYSYGPVTAYQDWSKMTVYLNGGLAWGIEP